MMECERCGADVERVLRYREYGVTVTHRVTRWLCRDCHPEAPTRRPSASDADADAEEPSGTAVTDGGVVAACPECAASTTNVHGIGNCVECRWTNR
ncbi:hypothetical protein [Salinigranum marinum]|uniref:hypothetical protein n=1 Tax=Salinigranum marinum TaxID=1515595 RepID=UPI002989F756|nr:hypothetical protein [Salinigranum marinum]